MNKPLESFLQAPSEAQALRDGVRVGISRPHESAHLHVAGEAAYIDDLPELAGTLHIALGLSPVAHGRLIAIDLDAVRAMPGVVDVLTAADGSFTFTLQAGSAGGPATLTAASRVTKRRASTAITIRS